MPHQTQSQLQYHLMEAHLYGLLAKRYEYVDPAKHIHFYKKYFEHVQHVESIYMGMTGCHHMGSNVNPHMSSHMHSNMSWYD
jgi:hypothetical protein